VSEEFRHKDTWTLDTFRALMNERLKCQPEAIKKAASNIVASTQQIEPNEAPPISYTLDLTKTLTENISTILDLLFTQRSKAVAYEIMQTLILSRNDEWLLCINTNAFGISGLRMLEVSYPKQLNIQLTGHLDHEATNRDQKIWDSAIYNRY